MNLGADTVNDLSTGGGGGWGGGCRMQGRLLNARDESYAALTRPHTNTQTTEWNTPKTGTNIHETREWVMRNSPVPVGTVPIYQARGGGTKQGPGLVMSYVDV